MYFLDNEYDQYYGRGWWAECDHWQATTAIILCVNVNRFVALGPVYWIE